MQRSRNLVACCDGTWNTRNQDAVTNVVKLFNALQQDDEQVCHYQSGVGTSGGPISWALGGATGVGLSHDVMAAYYWLTTHYQKGDRIWLFGFSRGAYTARSVAGMIAKCGLIRPAPGVDVWARVESLYRDVYRNQNPLPEGLELSFHPSEQSTMEHPYPVYFIGVWDTVGALGVPDYFALLSSVQKGLGILDGARWSTWQPLPTHYAFHDVKLNPRVSHARHALAMDEERTPFAPTLWDGPNSDRLKQVWFPGGHMDVGGGYADDGLSNGALLWMIEEARRVNPAALRFDDGLVDTIHENPRALLHDDKRSALSVLPPLYTLVAPIVDYLFAPQPRAVPPTNDANRTAQGNGLGSVHQSVYDRQRDTFLASGPYRRHHVLREHDGFDVTVDAREYWNATSIYLEPGVYTFHAEGRWQNLERWSDPDGEPAWPLRELRRFVSEHPTEALRRGLATCADLSRRALIRLTNNPDAHVVLNRREARSPWMSLIGLVANGGLEASGKDRKHQTFRIGSDGQCTVWQPGYLYTFANNAPGLYSASLGDTKLHVERVA